MYLSHPVRTIRDDPMAETSVDLVVTLEADTELSDAFGDEVGALGGEVLADLQFSAVHVRLPETAVADLCALDGIDRIETAETLRLVGDEATGSASDTGRPATDERQTDTTRSPDRDREQ